MLILSSESGFLQLMLAFAEGAMIVGARYRPVGKVQNGGGSRQVTSPSSKGSFYVADYKVVLVIARPPQKHSTLERIDQLSRHEIAREYAAVLCHSFFLSSISKVFARCQKIEDNVECIRVRLFQESPRFPTENGDVDEMKSRAPNRAGYTSWTYQR